MESNKDLLDKPEKIIKVFNNAVKKKSIDYSKDFNEPAIQEYQNSDYQKHIIERLYKYLYICQGVMLNSDPGKRTDLHSAYLCMWRVYKLSCYLDDNYKKEDLLTSDQTMKISEKFRVNILFLHENRNENIEYFEGPKIESAFKKKLI